MCDGTKRQHNGNGNLCKCNGNFHFNLLERLSAGESLLACDFPSSLLLRTQKFQKKQNPPLKKESTLGGGRGYSKSVLWDEAQCPEVQTLTFYIPFLTEMTLYSSVLTKPHC